VGPQKEQDTHVIEKEQDTHVIEKEQDTHVIGRTAKATGHPCILVIIDGHPFDAAGVTPAWDMDTHATRQCVMGVL